MGPSSYQLVHRCQLNVWAGSSIGTYRAAMDLGLEPDWRSAQPGQLVNLLAEVTIRDPENRKHLLLTTVHKTFLTMGCRGNCSDCTGREASDGEVGVSCI